MDISIELIDSIVPHRGALVLLAEVYVDETNTHDGPEFISVAGYIFLKKNAKAFSRDFAKCLKKYKLPYFHMKECIGTSGIFAHLSEKQAIKVEKNLIRNTKKYSEMGFSISLHKKTYNSVVPAHLRPELGSEYSFCLREVFTMVRRWAERTSFDGDISYFFESGADHQSEADQIITQMFKSASTKNRFLYASHTFALKKKFLPLGCADLLAWLHQNHEKRSIALEPRKDFVELLRPQDMRMHLGKDQLNEMFEKVLKRFSPPSLRVIQ